MNWQKVVLLAFSLSIMYVYAPLITLLAGAILLVIYNRQEIKNVASKSLSFIQVLFMGFIIAVTVQVVLTIIFGASFDILVQAGGWFNGLKDPDPLRIGVIKEVFALIIVFCATYLVVTAEKPQRWLFKWAMVLSLVALLFQCWNVSLSAGSQARHTMRLSLLREEILANADARLKKLGLMLKRNTVLNEYAADMPAVYYAANDAYLYEKDGNGVKRGELIEAGSRWFYLTDGETITDAPTGITYEPVAAYEDETKRGWLRLDRISKSEPVAKSKPMALPVIQSVLSPAQNMASRPAVAVALAKVEPAVAAEAVGVDSDRVLAKSGVWTKSQVTLQFSDHLVLGPLAALEDVERLEVKLGGQLVPNCRSEKTDAGNWSVVLDLNAGGENGSCQSVELRLQYGFPLNVDVHKIKGESR